MKIGFLSNKLTLRGTETNLYEYAHHNESILKNQSIIITRPYDHVMQVSPGDVHPEAYKKFTDRFDVKYYIHLHDIVNIIKDNNLNAIFIEKGGDPYDGLVFDCCKTIIHAVFDSRHPHGDLFTVISDDINHRYNTSCPVLPNMVNVYDTNEDLRNELKIPKDALVFGAHCGATAFDLKYVQDAVKYVGTNPCYSNIYFVFLNVNPFCAVTDRIFFLPGTADMKRKRMFINTCDAMVYGRTDGETFGIACGEFSLCNKPIIARNDAHDRAHFEILGDKMIKHSNYGELVHILTHWDSYKIDVFENGYKQYTPENVIQIFDKMLKTIL